MNPKELKCKEIIGGVQSLLVPKLLRFVQDTLQCLKELSQGMEMLKPSSRSFFLFSLSTFYCAVGEKVGDKAVPQPLSQLSDGHQRRITASKQCGEAVSFAEWQGTCTLSSERVRWYLSLSLMQMSIYKGQSNAHLNNIIQCTLLFLLMSLEIF